MKKLITVILILSMLLPAAALAGESDVVGCWAYYSVSSSGTPSMEMIYLADDHTCYFLIQSFDHDEPSLGRAFVGTWEMQQDGSVFAKTGNNTNTTLMFDTNEYAVAYNPKANKYYINAGLIYR
jgi:hypothetical protein